MTWLRLSYGQLPSREEFEAHFRANVPERNTGGRYGIAHGLGHKVLDRNDEPFPGSYGVDELWDEVNRLHKRGSDVSIDWVSSILYTLEIEWI